MIMKKKINKFKNTLMSIPGMDNVHTGDGHNKHKAKKSLGQNFLKSKEALRAICDAGRADGGDIVLEIGPGKGALTEELLKRGASVVAIEKDRDLIEILNEKFEKEIKNKKLEIINDDILSVNLPKVFLNFSSGLAPIPFPSSEDPRKISEIFWGDYKVISNIPYNITGAIIKKFLSEVENKPILMAILVQKEVAERIVARDGKESILSLSVRAYGEPKYIMKVSKKYFSPSPKVDSAIILINNISDKNFKNKNDEEMFFKIVKAGFVHKRKVLIKNLEVGLPDIKNNWVEIFEKLGINKKARAEDLKFQDWMKILEFYTKNI